VRKGPVCAESYFCVNEGVRRYVLTGQYAFWRLTVAFALGCATATVSTRDIATKVPLLLWEDPPPSNHDLLEILFALMLCNRSILQYQDPVAISGKAFSAHHD
jgi:hypothetical protein